MTATSSPRRPVQDNHRHQPAHSPRYCRPGRAVLLLLCCAVPLATCLGGCGEQSDIGYQPRPMASSAPASIAPAASIAVQPPLPSANRAPSVSSPRRSVGSYHAQRISGDFAGYAGLQRFIDQMVQQHGFDRAYLMGLFSQAHRKNWTLDYLAKSDQTIKGKPAIGGWDRYRAKFLDKQHIDTGVAFARRHRQTLQRATRQYGVPEEYILGILAVETTFGGNVGNHRILDALTTLSFDYARRGEFFRSELEQFLLMSRDEGLDPVKPVGSFAGAMGLGQFMPSSFRQWAVDFNGDGRKDLWNADDAIGSVANYFAQHGWRAGQPVVTPARTSGVITLEPGLDKKYSLAVLRQAGVQPADPCKPEEPLHLLQLRYRNHDQYLIGHANFYAITRYNQSTYYAMTVHELAQTIKGNL